MQSGIHHIRSQRWQIKTASQSTAFAVRQELRSSLEGELLPAFERAFDDVVPDDQLLHIPSLKLHLQLQLHEGSNLVAALATIIEAELRAALLKAIRPVVTSEDTRFTSGVHSTTAASAAVQTWDTAEHRRAMLVEYLRTGQISWQAKTHETSSLLAWLQEEAEQLATDLPSLERIMIGTLEARQTIGFRFLQLIAPATSSALLLQRASSPTSELIAVFRQLATRLPIGSFLQIRVAALLLVVREPDLSATVQSISTEPPSGIVEQLLAACSAKLAAGSESDVRLAGSVNRLLRRTEQPAVTPREPLAGGPVSRPPSAPHAQSATQKNSEQRRIEIITTGKGADSGSSHSADVVWRVAATEPSAATSQLPGLLVGDAGVILLHPFLPRLFEATGIAATNSRRLSAIQVPRAAALLHWLVSGREEVFEFELSIIKVLLGLTPSDPLVVAEGLLSEDDRAEGDTLLAAVIEHWTALRNTTAAGLRVSFLQRRGLLRHDEAGWWLRVEAESFDMLLGQLPWGISLVKLPWMTKPIFTDWPTL